MAGEDGRSRAARVRPVRCGGRGAVEVQAARLLESSRRVTWPPAESGHGHAPEVYPSRPLSLSIVQ